MSLSLRLFVQSVAIAAVIFVSPLNVWAARLVFETNFESDPILQGWGNAANPPGLNAWTSDDAFSPTHSLRVHDSLWYTPILPLEPFKFYSVEFQGRTSGRGMWGPLNDPWSEYRAETTWQRNLKVFRDEPGAYDRRLIFKPTESLAPVYIDDVVVKELTSGEAAAMQDEFFATMPAFTFTPPNQRQAHIPRTIEKLRGGEELKIVMLGDSIVNDTSRGYFEPLVERKYPGSKLQVVTSVRNATGMWWYKEENRVQSYVLDHEPDVVMIGGISHRDDIESVREVIRQIRSARPETEFVLMSEAAGHNDPHLKPELLESVDPTKPGWRSELYCLAVEANVEFLDMTQPWAQYVMASGQSHDYLLRDAIHMNARGSQVAGRIIEAYFTPVHFPEPGAVTMLAAGVGAMLRRDRRTWR